MTKPKTARPVHANRGIATAYQRAIQKLIAQMHGSVEYWVKAAYRKHPPRVADLVEQAHDDSAKPSYGDRRKWNIPFTSDAFPGFKHYHLTNEMWQPAKDVKHPPRIAAIVEHAMDVKPPAEEMSAALAGIGAKWEAFFDGEEIVRIAETYVYRQFKATDSAFRAALKDAGWSVEFKMTPAMNDALQASIAENVGLIRSIPAQYLQQVEGIVMRSYSAGRDLETMVKELNALYPKASHRAVLIARDQSNKANAVVNRTRQLELGITEAIWMHSHAGKEPRPDHVAADGKRFKVAEGCLISGKYLQPGTEINCRCASRAVLPF